MTALSLFKVKMGDTIESIGEAVGFSKKTSEPNTSGPFSIYYIVYEFFALISKESCGI